MLLSLDPSCAKQPELPQVSLSHVAPTAPPQRSGTCSQRVHCVGPACVSAIFALVALLLILPRSAAATSAEDFYIAGYTSAVLEREFKVRAATVKVKDGVVTLVEAQLGGAQTREKVVSEISAIRGVVRVELSQAQVEACRYQKFHGSAISAAASLAREFAPEVKRAVI